MMENMDYACRLSNGLREKFSAIDDLDVKKIIECDEDLLNALVFTFFVLSKDKLLYKVKDEHDPVNRLKRHIPDSYIEELFSGINAPVVELPKKHHFDKFVIDVGGRSDDSIISDCDYNIWCLDNFRDSFMHNACCLVEEVGEVSIINDEFMRWLFAFVPVKWFHKYIDSDPVSHREFYKYTYKGFYYNKLEEKNNIFLPDDLLKRTIMYQVYVKSTDGNKINEKEISEFISSKFLEFSKEDTNLDFDIPKYARDIPGKDRRYDLKYVVSFYKAKNRIVELLKEKYPNIYVDIRIDDHKYKISNKITWECMGYYLNYQDIYDDFSKVFVKKSDRLLNSMFNLYNFIKDNQNSNKTSSELICELIKTITGNNGVYSLDDRVSIERVQETKEMLKLMFFYIYGINIIALNDDILNDPSYLQLIEDKCCGGKKDIYNRHMRQLLCRVKELDRSIDNASRCLKNYMQAIASPNVTPESRVTVRSNFIDALDNVYKKVDGLKSEIDFKKFNRNRHNRKKVEPVVNVLNGRLQNVLDILLDIKTDKDTREIKIDEVKCLIKEIKQLEDSFVFGACDGSGIKDIIRNCLAHPGRIDFGSSCVNNVYFSDYNEKNEKAGIAICNEYAFIDVLSGAVDSYIDNYGDIYQKKV